MLKSITLLFLFFLIISCKKNKQNENFGNLILRLTDSPASYEHIFIEINDIEVYHETNGWIRVGPQQSGIYDLLAFNNGYDTLLANATIPTGTISQIRLVLGTNNSLVVAGNTFNLQVPSAQQSGLKINLNHLIEKDQSITRWLDIDAAKSVIELGNNNYQLKPVLRTYTAFDSGILNGKIVPSNAEAIVRFTKGNDTLFCIPELDGFFSVGGLNGHYDIKVQPSNLNFSDTNIYNILVTPASTISLGNITLQ